MSNPTSDYDAETITDVFQTETPQGETIQSFSKEQAEQLVDDEEFQTDFEKLLENPTKARAWVIQVKYQGGGAVRKLAENFMALLDRVKAWEEREYLPEDWPHFEKEFNTAVEYCIFLGTRWDRSMPGGYSVVDDEDGFYGFFTDKKNASEVAENVDGGRVLKESFESNAEEWVENRFGELGDDTFAGAIRKNLKFLHENRNRMSGELADEMPEFDSEFCSGMVYGALFGELWELSYPTLYAVFNKDKEFVDVIHGTNKDSYPDSVYSFTRIGVEDGETTTADLKS